MMLYSVKLFTFTSLTVAAQVHFSGFLFSIQKKNPFVLFDVLSKLSIKASSWYQERGTINFRAFVGAFDDEFWFSVSQLC